VKCAWERDARTPFVVSARYACGMTQQENIRDRERFERYLTAAITGLLANATRFERHGQKPVEIANEAWEIARTMQTTVQKWEKEGGFPK